jgi:hypothetical protein
VIVTTITPKYHLCAYILHYYFLVHNLRSFNLNRQFRFTIYLNGFFVEYVPSTLGLFCFVRTFLLQRILVYSVSCLLQVAYWIPLTARSRISSPTMAPGPVIYDVGRRAVEPVDPVLWYMPVTACIDTDRLHRLQQIDTAYSTYEPVPVVWILINDK